MNEYIFLVRAGLALFSATVLMKKPDPDVKLTGTITLIANIISLLGRG